MKKVILIFLAIVIALSFINRRKIYFVWRYAVSSSPVVWENVEINFPDGYMYTIDGGLLSLGDWMHAAGGLSFTKDQDVSQAERTMGRFEADGEYMKRTQCSAVYGGKNAEVLELEDRNDPGSLTVFVAFKEAGLLVVYNGPRENYPAFEPIVAGLKFLQ